MSMVSGQPSSFPQPPLPPIQEKKKIEGREIRPQAASSFPRVEKVLSQLVTGFTGLFQPHPISTIPFMLRSKLENELKTLSDSQDAISFVFKPPDLGDKKSLIRNPHMVELSWSHDNPEFAENSGRLIMRYFDPDSNAIIMKPCDVSVTNRFSLKQLTSGVVDSLKTVRMDVNDALRCELETKAIVLEHEFKIPVVLTPEEAEGKSALLLKEDGTLTLYREHFEPVEVMTGTWEEYAPCTVFTDSIDDIRQALQKITNEQNERLFNEFDVDSSINIPGVRLERVSESTYFDKERTISSQLTGHNAPQFLISVDQAQDKTIMLEPQIRIYFAWGNKIYSETAPFDREKLIEQVKDLKMRVDKSNAQIREVHDAFKKRDLPHIEFYLGSDGRMDLSFRMTRLEKRYHDYFGARKTGKEYYWSPIWPTRKLLKDLALNFSDIDTSLANIHAACQKGAALSHLTEAMNALAPAEKLLLPGEIKDREDTINKLKQKEYALAVEWSPKCEALQFLVYDASNDTSHVYELKVNPNLSLEETKAALKNAVKEALELPAKRKAEAAQAIQEVEEDEEFAPYIASGAIKISLSKDASQFLVTINDPLAEHGKWEKATVGVNAGIGVGDGMLLDVVGEAFERAKILASLKESAEAIIQEVSPLLSGSMTITATNHNSTILIQAPDGTTQSINLLEYALADATKLVKAHLQDMQTKMELQESSKLTRATRLQVTERAKAKDVSTDGVELAELQTMWGKINFTDPSVDDSKNKALYADPNKIDDGGVFITAERAKRGLDQFIANITQRNSDAFGVADNAIARKNYYDKMEKSAKVIIARLRTLEETHPARFVTCLLEIGAAGSHCGSRYINTMEYLDKLTSGELDESAAGVQAEIVLAIDRFKSGMVDQWVAKFEAGEPTHIRNYAYRRLQQEGIRLTGQEMLTGSDHFEAVGLYPIVRAADPWFRQGRIPLLNLLRARTVANKEIKDTLLPQFTASNMVEVVQSTLQHRSQVDEPFREQMVGNLFEQLKKQGRVDEQVLTQLDTLEKEYKESQSQAEDVHTVKRDYKSYQRDVLNVQFKALQQANWIQPIEKVDGSKQLHFSTEAVAALLKGMGMISS